MSAYGHQMEREYSVQSLSSRGGSEMGNRDEYESGFYITSFAATMFIAGLVTVAVLFITLITSLTVMLQSCEKNSSGVIQSGKYHYNDDYCKIFVFHAEINKLKADEFPSICIDYAARYVKEGQYLRDLNFSISITENYFGKISPGDNHLGVVLIDIDNIFASSSDHSDIVDNSWRDHIEMAIHLRHIFLRMYSRLRDSGWPLILITRRPQGQQNITSELLLSAGFAGWASLIMRSNGEMAMTDQDYFSRRMTALENKGFHIMAVISSSMDALTGPFIGKRVFKIPYPIFLYVKNDSESKLLSA